MNTISHKFSVHHVGNDKWSVKNELGEWWTDNDGWVAPGSSYWALTPDCWNKELSYDELWELIYDIFGYNKP